MTADRTKRTCEKKDRRSVAELWGERPEMRENGGANEQDREPNCERLTRPEPPASPNGARVERVSVNKKERSDAGGKMMVKARSTSGNKYYPKWEIYEDVKL